MPVGVDQVHVEDDRVRADLAYPRHRLPTLRHLVDRVTGPRQDRPEQRAVRRAVVDNQDGTHESPVLSIESARNQPGIPPRPAATASRAPGTRARCSGEVVADDRIIPATVARKTLTSGCSARKSASRPGPRAAESKVPPS